MIGDLPPGQPQQAIEAALVECGLPRGGFTVQYEDFLQSFEIRIPATTKVGPDQFSCLHKAAGSEIVSLEDPETSAAFSAFQSEAARPYLLAMTKRDAEQAGLMENFPKRADYRSTEEFARALEMHVGVAPGSRLGTSGESIFFLPRKLDAVLDDPEFKRLTTATMYSMMSDDEAHFVLIGNEAVDPTHQEK